MEPGLAPCRLLSFAFLDSGVGVVRIVWQTANFLVAMYAVWHFVSAVFLAFWPDDFLTVFVAAYFSVLFALKGAHSLLESSDKAARGDAS
jgi:hypothetical protein